MIIQGVVSNSVIIGHLPWTHGRQVGIAFTKFPKKFPNGVVIIDVVFRMGRWSDTSLLDLVGDVEPIQLQALEKLYGNTGA